MTSKTGCTLIYLFVCGREVMSNVARCMSGYLILLIILFHPHSLLAEELSLCDEIGALSFDADRVASPVSSKEYDPFKVASACENALRSEPNNPRFHFQLGVALAMQANLKAIDHLETAAAKNYEAAEKALKIFFRKKEEQTEEGLRLSKPSPGTLNECDRIGSAPIDTARVGEPVSRENYNARAVEEACREALVSDPDNLRFHFQLGLALLGTGQPEIAVKHLGIAADGNYVAAKLALKKLHENLN